MVRGAGGGGTLSVKCVDRPGAVHAAPGGGDADGARGRHGGASSVKCVDRPGAVHAAPRGVGAD
eukprot:210130-Chlamydomonas_euryale.AAC.1